jgi:hypothetical protein
VKEAYLKTLYIVSIQIYDILGKAKLWKQQKDSGCWGWSWGVMNSEALN